MRWLAVVGVICSSCVRPPPVWWRAGATVESQRLDTYECDKDARYTGWSANRWRAGSYRELDKEMFQRCMEAHGYVLVEAEEIERHREAAARGPYLPPPVTAAGPDGPYTPDAGIFQPRKVE